MKKGTHVHFVGIGGIGMSGIAEVLFSQGYPVSGSDLQDSDTTRRLRGLGLHIQKGHRAKNISGSEVVVISSAVKASDPEVIEARRLGIPVIPRAEMLGELMRGKIGLAIAGTHGKTTTTSILATILTHAQMDPTLLIGGKVDSLGGNAKHGKGSWVVAEADESDGSFLHLPTTYAVITNIDNDHLDHFGTLEAVEDAFVNFVAKIPFYGAVAVCGEDAGVRRCLHRFIKPYVTYGFSDQFDVYAYDVECLGRGSAFKVRGRAKAGQSHEEWGKFEVHTPGTHNVLNSLAAIAICYRIGIPFEQIRVGLSEFSGVKRRFDIRWNNPDTSQLIVDDYGHHPTEILATLRAARTFWKGRIIAVFQPHRFSRTQNCWNEFLKCFEPADIVLVTDIYPAGEEPIAGIDSARLAKGMSATYVGDLASAAHATQTIFKEGDMVLCLGAGSITKLPDLLKR